MDNIELLLSLVISMGSLCCLLAACLLPPAVMLGLPFAYRSTFLSWTTDRTATEAFDAVAVGATRGLFQIRPASFVYEEKLKAPMSPAEALETVKTQMGKSLFTKVLIADEGGVVINMRFPEQVGPGWVGVVLAKEHEGGCLLDCRFRSTFVLPFPVLTFFLSLSLRLHLRRMLLG